MQGRHFKDAEKVFNELGNFDDDLYFYDSYPPEKYGGKFGSLVPFPLRIIAAELQYFCADESSNSQARVTIDMLYELMSGLSSHIGKLLHHSPSIHRAASARDIRKSERIVENMGLREAHAWRRQIQCE